MTSAGRAAAQAGDLSTKSGETMGRPQYTPRRALDRIYDEEQAALAIWTQLVSRGLREPLSPQLKRIAMSAWRAYGALSRERDATERAWGR